MEPQRRSLYFSERSRGGLLRLSESDSIRQSHNPADTTAMTDDTLSLQSGDHACFLYQGFVEQKATILPFLNEGLLQRERCIYVADEDQEDEMCLELQAYGIDVEAEKSAGHLIIGRTQNRFALREFNSIHMARQVWGLLRPSLSVYSGVRMAINRASVLALELSADQLCHWEATLNLLQADLPVRTICMYDRNALSTAKIHAALRTHSVVLAKGKPRRNPYFEAPAILAHEPHLNASMADDTTVDRMIARLVAES